MSTTVYFFTFLEFLLAPIYCANILVAYDTPSPSHHIWNYALAKGLVDRGHNVTMIGPFAERDKPSANYHPITIKEIIAAEAFNPENLVDFSPLEMLLWQFDISYKFCNVSYSTDGFKHLKNYPKDFKFDAILYDMTLHTCLYPLIDRFGYPPSIGVTPFLLPTFISDLFGNSLQPSYIPFCMLSNSEHMDFIQRIWNYIFTLVDVIKRQHYDIYQYEKLANDVLGKRYDFSKIERHISLFLANYSPQINEVQPLTPNIIAVGGLHVKPAGKLPAELQTMADNAKNGFIFFALGTNVEPSNFRKEKIEAILEAIGRLKDITVIWKVKGQFDKKFVVPTNLKIMKWVPQNDILGHPNLKLFINHGGALSFQEAAYHGVPILGMPFFMDQYQNVLRIKQKKIGLSVDYQKFTADSFYKAIQEMLSNPIYRNNAKMMSKKIKDQPETPLNRAVFWIEHAIRHNGTEYLNPVSRDMSRFIISNMDVLLFLSSIPVLIMLALRALIKAICYRKPVDKKIKVQ